MFNNNYVYVYRLVEINIIKDTDYYFLCTFIFCACKYYTIEVKYMDYIHQETSFFLLKCNSFQETIFHIPK